MRYRIEYADGRCCNFANSRKDLLDDRIEKAVRQNHVRLVIIDPVQAFIGADVDMNRANEVRPVF